MDAPTYNNLCCKLRPPKISNWKLTTVAAAFVFYDCKKSTHKIDQIRNKGEEASKSEFEMTLAWFSFWEHCGPAFLSPIQIVKWN